MNKILLLSFLLVGTISLNAKSDTSTNSADCLIIKDENSIICKYTNTRANEDRTVFLEWINPNEEISRKREVIVPAGHGSVYDFRYIEGRTKGIWTFKVQDKENTYSTTFEIK